MVALGGAEVLVRVGTLVLGMLTLVGVGIRVLTGVRVRVGTRGVAVSVGGDVGDGVSVRNGVLDGSRVNVGLGV
jgi:hypothetical protein